MCQFEVLQAGVRIFPGLYRPDEPKLVHKVGFIREKGKAAARAVHRSPETDSSLFR
jgi:hypothetical protein